MSIKDQIRDSLGGRYFVNQDLLIDIFYCANLCTNAYSTNRSDAPLKYSLGVSIKDVSIDVSIKDVENIHASVEIKDYLS